MPDSLPSVLQLESAAVQTMDRLPDLISSLRRGLDAIRAREEVLTLEEAPKVRLLALPHVVQASPRSVHGASHYFWLAEILRPWPCETLEMDNPKSDNDGLSDNEGLSDGSSATHEFGSNEEVIDPRIAGRKRRTVDEDDLINKLAQTINHQFENAFNSTFFPLVSALRRREEEEQKHREHMLALEEEKLALKREKFLFKRRRVQALTQPNPRASHSSRSGHKKHGQAVRRNLSPHLKPDPRASVF